MEWNQFHFERIFTLCRAFFPHCKIVHDYDEVNIYFEVDGYVTLYPTVSSTHDILIILSSGEPFEDTHHLIWSGYIDDEFADALMRFHRSPKAALSYYRKLDMERVRRRKMRYKNEQER